MAIINIYFVTRTSGEICWGLLEKNIVLGYQIESDDKAVYRFLLAGILCVVRYIDLWCQCSIGTRKFHQELFHSTFAAQKINLLLFE